uniref:Prefoldin subunit 5 n=1 Tax=Strigamia maritima TaxID=126957 RepID=T1ISQ0_STRMM
MAASKGQTVDISKLNLGQLNQLKQQLDQEIELFSSSLQQLKLAQTKFQDSGDCLEKINPDNDGKEILVPLTGSMYVPGTLTDVNNVYIDIGTGYYVENNVEKAKNYFKRKVKYVTEQMEKIQTVAQNKVAMREAVMEVMEMKIQTQLQNQQQLTGVKT